METIEISCENIRTGTGHSSKGNQLKWKVGDWWYKADAFGYESLSEVIASHFLGKSNLSPDEVVLYEPVWIVYHGRKYRGCRSRSFLGGGEELVTLERLSRAYTGFSLAGMFARIDDTKERILYAEELVRNTTGIENFGIYLLKMLEIDAFFLNEDRHTNNIALLYEPEHRTYRLCPFFDMGLSMFSDTREEYPLGGSLEAYRKAIQAKPFHRDFDVQLDAANELYGSFLKFEMICSHGADILEELDGKYHIFAGGDEMVYIKEEAERVDAVLRYQAGKYRYMFA